MNIVQLISEERLNTYESITGDRKKAIALHNHTLQLGSSIMSMIAIFELAFRNSANQRIVEDFGDENWLIPGHQAFPLRSLEREMISKAHSQAKRGPYSKLSYKQKTYLDAFAFPGGLPHGISHQKKVKARQQLFVVSHGQVISQTTLAFWKKLYSSEYENDLWKPCLKRVFPNKALKRRDVSKPLEAVYSARNRAAHHEPIYGTRLEQTMAALAFLRSSLGAKSEESETAFKNFSKVLYLRLQMDYENFKEAWETLT